MQQLLVQAEAGRTVAQRGIGTSHDAHAGPEQGTRHGDALAEQLRAVDIRVRRNAVDHRKDSRDVGLERVRQVLLDGIAREIALRPARYLDLRDECRHDPGPVALQFRIERRLVERVAPA